ncbi:MAG: DUF192 domain-containing protein [Candidatus Moranbacteria bacterium]|nr:DUF192 domain-containing protein [Candidatus Moranbacteria bacterium]
MKKFLLAAVFFLLAVLIIDRTDCLKVKNEFKIVKINGIEFQAQTASSSAQRSRGLSGRKNLGDNCAMLFLFPQAGNYQFWMRGMKFDIDMIWVSGLEVVQIDSNVSYERGADEIRNSRVPADKVMELPAGTAEKIGLRIGDKIEIK